MTRSTSLIVSFALLVASACGGGDGGPTGAGNNVSLTGDGGIRATINGVAWRSTKGADRATRSGQVIAIAGLNLPWAMTFGLGLVTGPSTVSLSYGANTGSTAIVSGTGGGWGTGLPGGSGSITITVLTASRIAGTFSFDAVPGSGAATGTMQVRNGTFDVPF